tara:strand:- start:737 stop:1624 length:888 start_codon:yes stop_codon:yes gene_type:complete
MKWQSLPRAKKLFLKDLKIGRSENTLRTVNKNLERILNDLPDDPREINFNVYFEALERLQSKYKSSTVNKTHRAACRLFKWIKLKDYERINSIRINITWDRIETYTKNELNQIIDWCLKQKSTLWRMRLSAFLLILSSSGMRGGECQKLKWLDLDFENSIFHIKKTKTGESRFAAIHKNIIPYLKIYRTKINEELEYNSEYIFPSIIHPMNYVSYNSLKTKMNNELSKELGFQINCKKFRSTMVKLVVESDGGYEKAAAIVGHKNIGITQKHYHRITLNKKSLDAHSKALADINF